MDHRPTPLQGNERERLDQAANLLIEGRRTLEPMEDLPPALRPKTLEEAYYVQDVILRELGEVGGWKVGAPSPEATPLYAPMPVEGFSAGDGTIAGPRRLRGVEAEFAFLLKNDLPPRANPYSREEIVDAIASCHTAIELLESGLLNPDTADRLSAIADLQTNGGFVYGEPLEDWRDLNFADVTGEMQIDGFVRVSGGKNSAGSDLLRLVQWLANEAHSRTGGLRAGQWITTGSWTGKAFAEQGSTVVARFPRVGELRLRFA
jgi:2-keto-4-pentenoate hydratase